MDAQPLPATFQGGPELLEKPDTAEIDPGPVAKDAYFARMNIQLGRSARLENDLHLRGGIIKKGIKVADAGDLFVALPINASSPYAATSAFSWCRAVKLDRNAAEVAANVVDQFFNGQGDRVCLFWLDGIARTAQGGGGSRLFPEGGRYDPNVWINTPELTELGPSGIGPLRVEVKIDTLKRNGDMRVEHMFRDPVDDRSTLFSETYQPGPDGSYLVDVFDGRVRITPRDDKLFDLAVVEPITGG